VSLLIDFYCITLRFSLVKNLAQNLTLNFDFLFANNI